MMKKPSYLQQSSEHISNVSESTSASTPLLDVHHTSKSLLANILDVSDDTVGRIRWYNESASRDFRPMQHPITHSAKADLVRVEDLSNLALILNSIRNELRVITDKIREGTIEEEMKRDWKFAAIVLDRLCLLLFTAVFSIATCAIIFAAPQLVV